MKRITILFIGLMFTSVLLAQHTTNHPGTFVEQHIGGIIHSFEERREGIPEQMRKANPDSVEIFQPLRISYYSSGKIIATDGFYVPIGLDKRRLLLVSVLIRQDSLSINGVGAAPLAREIQHIITQRGPTYRFTAILRVNEIHGDFLYDEESEFIKLYPLNPTRKYIANYYSVRYSVLSLYDLRQLFR